MAIEKPIAPLLVRPRFVSFFTRNDEAEAEEDGAWTFLSLENK
jgi:hypothetical protein